MYMCIWGEIIQETTYTRNKDETYSVINAACGLCITVIFCSIALMIMYGIAAVYKFFKKKNA